MMNHQTLDKLHALRWFGLAEAWRKQMENAEVASLSFDERFSLLVDQHWTWRENEAMARRLKRSKLDTEPCVEDIDFRHPRGLDRSLMRTLSNSQWGATSLPLVHRSDRNRQVVAGTGPGAEGLPGRVQRVVPAASETISGADGRACRWQPGPGVGNHRPR